MSRSAPAARCAIL